MTEKRRRYIYKITNLVNGKTYIGQRTFNTSGTAKNALADMYWGSGKLLKLAQTKYGLENFKKEILIEGFFTKSQLDRFERCAIRVERFLGKAEYNIANGGQGFDSSEASKYAKIGVKVYEQRTGKSWSQRAKEIAQSKSPEERRSVALKSMQSRLEKGNWTFTMKGKKLTQDQIQRMKESKRLNPPIGPKNGSFGKHWWTNGKENVKAEVCPEGFWKGRSCNKELHWYTNGTENIFSKTCPEGFVAGRSR